MGFWICWYFLSLWVPNYTFQYRIHYHDATTHPLTLEPLYRTRRVLRHQPAQGEDQRGKGEVRPRLVGSRLRDAVKELCRLFSRVVESRRSRRGSH